MIPIKRNYFNYENPYNTINKMKQNQAQVLEIKR